MPKCRRRLWRIALLPIMAFALLPAACTSGDESPPTEPDAAGTASAPEASSEATLARQDRVAAELTEFLNDARTPKATLGVCVVDVADGKTVFSAGADRSLIPASNMKLVTTAAALTRLGAQWRFRTFVGTLGDDLVVVAGGDPNFSGRFYGGDTVGAFRRWATILKARGVMRIDGDLVFDDSLFDAARHHTSWLEDDLASWSAAPVGALVVNDSCIDVYLRGAKQAGLPAAVRLDPATRYVTVRGTIRTRSPSKGIFSIDFRTSPRRLQISGHVPPKLTTDASNRPVDDPGLFAATVIAETLEAEGIPIAGQVVRRRLWTPEWRMPDAFRCHIIHSSSLAQTIRVANTRSQNLYAECLMKAVAAYGKSDDPRWPSAEGSWVAGGVALTGAMVDLGLEVEGCEFADGSGLSAENRLTADLLAHLLATMAGRDDADLWHGSLAGYRAAGTTLKKWPDAPALVGRVRAKSGKLTKPQTRCLSGYLDTASGRRLAFSFLANDIRGNHYAVMQWMAQALSKLSRL
jgi:serine-type D-Ala-D-Ala carboxypeptidase/endopeptidase (penicillin-binding protein 4)